MSENSFQGEAQRISIGFLHPLTGDTEVDELYYEDSKFVITENNQVWLQYYIFEESTVVVDACAFPSVFYESDGLEDELWDGNSKLWEMIAEKANSLAKGGATVSPQRLQAMYAFTCSDGDDTLYDSDILGDFECVSSDLRDDAGEFEIDERFINKFFLRTVTQEIDDEGYVEEDLAGGFGIVAF